MEEDKIKEQLQIASVIAKSLQGNVSNEEQEQLDQWLNLDKKNKVYYNQISKNANLDKKSKEYIDINVENARAKVWRKYKKSKRIKFFKNGLKYAAMFIGMVGLVYIYQYDNLFNQHSSKIQLTDEAITLQLDNGDIQVINTGGAKNIINKKGSIVGVQKGSKLKYEKNAEIEKLTYNQLTVPYGKTFQLVLSDGTQIHLNAGTSLKYPVKFIKGENRHVYLNGEAYFDVAKDEAHPFVVNVNDINVRVLGTQFNISSYPEEQQINTVLVEGSVRIFKKGESYSVKNSSLLKPGQKAAWSKTDKEILIEDVDTSIYTSWIEGELKFREVHFNEILKKLERRYDVSFKNNYKKLEEKQYSGTFDIENIDQVLKVFSNYALFTYTIKDQTIIINKPNKIDTE